jgi:hypothetical protein
MVDKASYPQIPSTVWWGVRNILKRTPGTAIDERTLGVELNVQETAARQYVGELKRVGILSDENKATSVAQKWRHDETYGEAVDELLRAVYPEGLTNIAPRGAADRQKIISWFTREGFGTGTAANKAATYLLISSESPNEPPARGNSGQQKTPTKQPQYNQRNAVSQATKHPTVRTEEAPRRPASTGLMPLNINVQIHISADASGAQIESIFGAMRRYLYDGTNS